MKHTKDMSTGSPLVALILFSLPIILGNLFQQFYNLMDIAIVGNKLGDDALAAVGATAALYGLFLSLAFGAANGFSLVIARYFGSKDIKGLHKAFAHALKLAVLIAVILTVVALFFTKPLLQLLHTPDVELSYRYISVVLLGITVTVFYNTLSSVLRAVGNSVAPLIFLIIGAFVNVGLDFAFIVLFDMGVFGAGLATVISQVVSCTLTAVYMLFFCKDLLPSKEDFVHDSALTKDLLVNAASMACMFSIVSIGSITLQFAVNNLGPLTVAAHTTARKIDETMMVVFAPLSMASATFASQNLGAGKTERIKRGIFTAFALGFAISLITIFITFTFGEFLVKRISGSSNHEVISQGFRYLKWNLPFYFFLVALVILRSTLQSIGVKVTPLIASFVEMIGKASIAFFLVPKTGYFGIIISEPIIWFVCSSIVGVSFVIEILKINKTAYAKHLWKRTNQKPILQKVKQRA